MGTTLCNEDLLDGMYRSHVRVVAPSVQHVLGSSTQQLVVCGALSVQGATT